MLVNTRGSKAYTNATNMKMSFVLCSSYAGQINRRYIANKQYHLLYCMKIDLINEGFIEQCLKYRLRHIGQDVSYAKELIEYYRENNDKPFLPEKEKELHEVFQ